MDQATKDLWSIRWMAFKDGVLSVFEWLMQHMFVYGCLVGFLAGLFTRIWF